MNEMNAEIMNECLLVVCWFVGMSCSLAMYVKVFEYGYKVTENGEKKCLIMAVLGLLFACYVNVIVNHISIEVGYPKDFVAAFFYLIVGLYCIYILFDALFKEKTLFKVAIQMVFFVLMVDVFRYVGVEVITKMLERKDDVSNSWIMECIVWCFLIERFIMGVEKKFCTTRIRMIRVGKTNEESIGDC